LPKRQIHSQIFTINSDFQQPSRLGWLDFSNTTRDGSCQRHSSFSNKVFRKGTNMFSVQYVHHSQLLDGGIIELADWDVNQLTAEMSGDPAPAGAWRFRAQQGDMALLGMQATRCDQAFLQVFSQIQSGIPPNVGNDHRREQD
jgi:hypothetical protein